MKVCVVGAGVSGLTAIKHLLEYGLEVVCYEAGQHIGGLWRYNSDDRNGFGSVMRNTILNTSKEFITFSDFPLDEKMANFPHNRDVYTYFESYAEHFQLKKHIQFGTRVIEIERTEDYDDTGNWRVATDKGSTVFNAVMICNGHHVKPYSPQIPGLEDFKGTVIHSHDYKDHRPFHDRRILVVGFGNSGGDAACELARVARQVVVSTRHGSWVTRRIVHQGYPRDVVLRTRYHEKAQKWLQKKIREWLSLYEYNSFFDHEKYGLRPVELPGQSPVLLADDLPLHLASGAVKIRGEISRFEENGVVFTNGTEELVDDVIMCTGYDFDFDYLENGKLIPIHDNQGRLWKRIFPVEEKHHTLAVIGLVDPLGPTITMAEMQSRVVAHIWANKISLPSKKQMNLEIDAEKAATAARFKCSARKASLQIDHISYMDSLALIIGCLPPLDKNFLLTDPVLAFMLHFGPVTATHYRITGPHEWNHAGSYIKQTFKRVHSGMNPQKAETKEGTPYGLLIFNNPTIILLVFTLFASYLLKILF